MDEDRQSVLDTAFENTQNVIQYLLEVKSPDDYLHRDEYIRIRSSNLTFEEQDALLNLQNDIDGVVLGLHSLESIKFQIRYINFLPYGISTLKPVYHILKKHLPLSEFKNVLPCLRDSRGIQLFYEHGWECYLALIPKSTLSTDKTPNNFISFAFEYFQRVVSLWRSSLGRLNFEGKCGSTIRKNCITILQKLHVLPDDQNEILQTLNNCIERSSPIGFTPYLFVFRFGERRNGVFKIADDFDTRLIIDQTIHIAATCSGGDHIGFLWSRQGLQNVIGSRGTLTSCLSFSEACNFQSNLDGRLLDVKQSILKLANFEGRVRFVQFYGDTPHIYPSGKKHPVSGSIVNSGLLHGNALASLEKDAFNYISVCKENVCSFGNDLKCRIEYVLAPSKIISEIDPKTLLPHNKLSQFLKNYSLVVPFDNEGGVLRTFLQVIGMHLIGKLEYNFLNGKRLGKYNNTWDAFMYELAIEKFLWGRPLSFYNPLLSINLGPGLGYPTRSKTDWLGFLALENSGSGFDDSPPPLQIWLHNNEMIDEVLCLFSFADYLNAANSVLGRKCLSIMLTDLYCQGGLKDKLRIANFLASLSSENLSPCFVLQGSISLNDLVKILSNGERVKKRKPTGRMFELLQTNERSVVDVLKAGFREAKYVFFPAVKQYDSSNNKALHWDGIRVWTLSLSETDDVVSDSICHSTTQLIIHELGSKSLIHSSKLVSFQNVIGFSFPWIKPILLKLLDCNLAQPDKNTILLFLSCVALLQQGWYVDFFALKKLERCLKISQFDLKGMEIQSHLLLGCVRIIRVWRLHESIPVKIDCIQSKGLSEYPQRKHVSENIKQTKAAELVLSDTEESPILMEDVVRIDTVRHYSAVCPSRWNADELEIMHRVSENSTLSARLKYEHYLEICRHEGVPDRSYQSFKRKLYRLYKHDPNFI